MPRFSLLAAGLSTIITVSAAGSASASFGDCGDPGYRENFWELPAFSWSEGSVCVEVLRIPFDTPGGPRIMRLVKDTIGATEVDPSHFAAYERGMRQSIAAFARIGDYRVADVTIFMNGRRFEPSEVVEARTWVDPGSECYITAHDWIEANIEFTVAHEIFHCVQFESLVSAQMDTSVEELWWIEGSAEWFAALAAPQERAALDLRFRRFAVRSEIEGIHALSYEAVVFFLWYADQHGPESVVPLLRRMTTSADPGAQMEKLRSILDDRAWLQFSQDYLDESITGYGPSPVTARGMSGRSSTWRP